MAFELSTARILATVKFPYFASAIMSLFPVEKSGIKTMAVDKFWRLYYDPTLEWTTDQIATVLIHEISHLLRAHPSRAEAIPDCNHTIFNIAADAEINDDLYEMPQLKGRWPHQIVLPNSFGMDDGKLAETYYAELIKNAEKIGCSCGQGDRDEGDACPIHGDIPDCGSGAHGKGREWDDGKPTSDNPGVSEVQNELIKRKVAGDIRDYNARPDKRKGSVPGSWLRWAEETLTSRIDWRKQLPQVLRQARATVSGRQDYSYQRPNRRSNDYGIIMPTLRAPDINIGVVVDTSGSIGQQELARILAEIKGMLRAYRNVTVYSVDAAVHSAQRLTGSPKNLKLYGGGGTDMALGIEYAAKQKHHAILVLTDGWTGWPDKEPPVPVVIGLIDSERTDVPAWARVVYVTLD